MTIGIYRLCFEGTSNCYVGQSVDIERRYKEHIRSFKNGTASPKLQNAYIKYNIPTLEILCEVEISELDDLEEEAIEIFDSYNNGFNSTNLITTVSKGEDHGNSKYSNKKIIEAAILLTNVQNTAEQISEKTNISVSTIRSIACLQNHSWLHEAVPEVVKDLKNLLGNRNLAGSGRKEYPAVRSPSGDIYKNILNFANFCKENGLDTGHFTNLLNGKLKSHKGWTLESTSPIIDKNLDPRCGKNKGIKYPAVKSPEGVVYKDIANAAEFCRQHSLNKSAFSQLLKAKCKSHKGWVLDNG